MGQVWEVFTCSFRYILDWVVNEKLMEKEKMYFKQEIGKAILININSLIPKSEYCFTLK